MKMRKWLFFSRVRNPAYPISTPGTRTIAIKDLRYIDDIPVLFLSELN